MQGDYAEASKYFSKAFSLSQSQNHRNGTESSSAHFGVSHTLSMFGGIKKHLIKPFNKATMGRIIGWKNQRQEEFSKPLPSDGKSTRFQLKSGYPSAIST